MKNFTTKEIERISLLNGRAKKVKNSLQEMNQAMQILTQSEDESGYNNESMFGVTFGDIHELIPKLFTQILGDMGCDDPDCPACNSKAPQKVKRSNMVVDYTTLMKIISILHTYKETELLEINSELSDLGVEISDKE